MYQLKAHIKQTNLATILNKYQNKEKYLTFCKTCGKYNNRWSCPPLGFNPDEYLAPYKYISLIAIQIFYDETTITTADTKEKINDISLKTTKTVKKQISELLLSAEQKFLDTLSLSSGGCDFCCKCTREKNEPCRKPEKMRYSLDAFGLDLTGITRDIFDIKLLWNSTALPRYHTLIHALLSFEPINEQELLHIINS